MSIVPLHLSRMFLRVLSLLLVSVSVLGARPLLAESDVEKTLAIVELRGGAAADERNSKYLRGVTEALRKEKSADLLLIDGQEAADTLRKDRNQLPSALTDERRSQLAEVRKRGTSLLDKADFQGAIKALNEAEGKYNTAVQAPGADAKLREEYLDVLMQLATAYVAAGDKGGAGETFRTVISTFGFKAKVTEDNFRPDVVELFKAELKKAEKAGKGSVEVTSTPPGAHIILGGNDRGTTPTTVADLVPGRYDLRLQLGNNSSLLRRVKIESGGLVKLSINLDVEAHLLIEDTHVGLAYADLGAAEARLAADAAGLGRDIKADWVCAVGLFDGKLAAFLVDVATGAVVRSVKDVKVPAAALSDKAISRAVVTILGERASAETKSVAAGAGGASAGKWHQSVPGWVAAGASVAMLGMGLAFSGNLGDVKAYYCADPSVDCGAANYNVKYQSNVDSFTADYKTKQTLSGVGLGSGVVLAGVAGWFFWREANKDGLAMMTVPDPQGRTILARVALPPLSLGSGPQRFHTR